MSITFTKRNEKLRADRIIPKMMDWKTVKFCKTLTSSCSEAVR
jgi:hypothetical protein